MSLEGKTAIVTGAARGIGQAIAVKLAKDGANLALCDLNADWLKETIGLVEAEGRSAKGYSVDVSDSAAVSETVKAVKADFETIDVLVNNAGITKDNVLIRMKDEEWDAVLDINLKGTFLFTRETAKVMMKQRSGTMVNIASVIGLMGNPGQTNYGASKAGVIALTKSVAKELASRGIRANAVAPGFIQTAMTEKLNEDQKQAMLDLIPLKKFGQPEDVADVVAFLAGDSSAFVTGQVVSICGGMVTH